MPVKQAITLFGVAELVGFLEVSDQCKTTRLERLAGSPPAARGCRCTPVGRSCLSQGQISHVSCIPGQTAHRHLPLMGSSLDGVYRKRSDHQQRAGLVRPQRHLVEPLILDSSLKWKQEPGLVMRVAQVTLVSKVFAREQAACSSS